MAKTNEIPIPNIGQTANLSLSDAIKEKKYLETYPKPPYGWLPGVANQIGSRITELNKIIADLVSAGRKN